MDTASIRRQMVDQQIRTWDIPEPTLLDLMRTVPREDFVPGAYHLLAYAETEIPLGHGERMMYPMVEGKLLQSLLLAPEDEVLEIGTGSGYLTACLALLAQSVVSVDIYQDFLNAAEEKLGKQNIVNVALKHHDAAKDGPPAGQFDAIAVTGSLPAIDERFIAALKPGGRLFIVTGNDPVMDAIVVTKDQAGAWKSSNIFETSLARLQNADEPPGFTW
ncbi:MAG: protein-L-isoaspartate O-methyltransferase [Woeseia sp.]|nr:protein-L-isoaspartate O-methyltransferase [Woeseia sp.]NNE61235.1 protein-L-isoaspartate O-methyltransferase [Woeseia sp.]NNL53592.1 protein-L-isoaspartate O-methyltransferase [Woeseia sp.]